jgi:hypothetical protein
MHKVRFSNAMLIITNCMGLKQFKVQIVFVFYLFLFIERCLVSDNWVEN